MNRRGRPDLVDLRTLTDRWRVRRDGEGLPVTPGRRGSVSPHDLTTLCVYVHGRPSLLKLLPEFPAGWRRHKVGDDEANLRGALFYLNPAATRPTHGDGTLRDPTKLDDANVLAVIGHHAFLRA